MISRVFTILVFLLFNISNSQNFIPLDEDTFEFIEDVNYRLFLNKATVFSGVCSNDKATFLPQNIPYDSICASKINYETKGMKREAVSKTIFLSKRNISLDEVVIVPNRKQHEIIIGEQNRFVKRMSNSFSKELLYGVVFENELGADVSIDKIAFFVDKIKYKTAYKINFYKFSQKPVSNGHQRVDIAELLFSTATLHLFPKQKDMVKIDLQENYVLEKNTRVFAAIELIDYYDENNKVIHVNNEDSSKLKFQISDKANYYAKMSDLSTSELTKDLININALINYDFAYQFFKKPHKSTIVAPAIILYASVVE